MAVRRGKIKRARTIGKKRARNIDFRRKVAIVLNSVRTGLGKYLGIGDYNDDYSDDYWNG